jgi:hypothetical protein
MNGQPPSYTGSQFFSITIIEPGGELMKKDYRETKAHLLLEFNYEPWGKLVVLVSWL